MNRHRVVIGPKSFDIEKMATKEVAADGEPQWQKLAYYRTRDGVMAGLRLRGLPAKLAAHLPRFHDDALRALLERSQPAKPRGRRRKGDDDEQP